MVATQTASIVLPSPGGPNQGEAPRPLDEGRVEVAQDHLALELGAEAEAELLGWLLVQRLLEDPRALLRPSLG